MAFESQQQLPPDNLEIPDWYGEKAKREQQRIARSVNIRWFAFGMLGALIVIVLSVIMVLAARNTNSQSQIPVVTASPTISATATHWMLPATPMIYPTYNDNCSCAD